ncbi:hypothetical protein [Candidatus Korobacter versatilis]|uniref:hypothetical protein n=1 Tax=Candidatus Korobacter versatilis TaxID=658062 RepID=UPI0011D0AEAC|nr:hypothetical protein [Candidatus Koribacter versatilis]
MRTLQVVCLAVLLCCVAFAQETMQASSAQPVVPHLIRFTGQVKAASGTVGITFSLHKAQEDSKPLWIETQNVKLDADGKYSVLLGATKTDGIPLELFSSGEAQWLSIRVEGQPEMPRVLLVSVPYALKAAEAETLAGHSLSEFVTTEKLSAMQQQGAPSSSDTTVKKSPGTRNAVGSGPTNFSGTTTDQIVGVTQIGTGAGVSSAAASGYAIYGKSSGTAIYGFSTATSTAGYGLYGATTSTSGYGVFGANNATTGTAVGVRGTSLSNGGIAVYGTANTPTGTATGVKGITQSPDGYGVFGQNTATTGNGIGVRANSSSTSGIALLANELAASGTTIGIQATAASANGTAAVLGNSNSAGKLISGRSGGSNTEVFSVNALGSGTFSGNGAPAIIGNVGCGAPSAGISFDALDGCFSYTLLQQNSDVFLNRPTGGILHIREGNKEEMSVGSGGSLTIAPTARVPGLNTYGGVDPTDFESEVGVYSTGGASTNGLGGDGMFTTGGASTNHYGGHGIVAIPGHGAAGDGLAGLFLGNVTVNGTFTNGAQRFQIDHPLDPANKYLSHASVQSSEMKNIYDGVAAFDANGEAIVQLPDWFEAENGNFRYQLTPIGASFTPYIATKVLGNRFKIAGGLPGKEVSWQVTGVRKDAYAQAHPLQVEEQKPEGERGYYISPELYGAPPEKQTEWARRPGTMKRMRDNAKPNRGEAFATK